MNTKRLVLGATLIAWAVFTLLFLLAWYTVIPEAHGGTFTMIISAVFCISGTINIIKGLE